jgi:predicted RNase H-like nuclease (RuvC/YqgF family)
MKNRDIKSILDWELLNAKKIFSFYVLKKYQYSMRFDLNSNKALREKIETYNYLNDKIKESEDRLSMLEKKIEHYDNSEPSEGLSREERHLRDLNIPFFDL